MDIKIPDTVYPVHEIITKRWSARSFAKTSISENAIKTLLEAASWAPSAMNEQPWRYIVALKENKEGFNSLLSCLNSSNAIWAGDAGALIFCYTRLNYTKNGKENPNAFHDTGMANQNLLLQAVTMNIYGHPMEGFDKQLAMEKFNISDTYRPVCMLALGYPGNPEDLEEPFRSREVTPRQRKPLSEFVVRLES